jgi:TIR domain
VQNNQPVKSSSGQCLKVFLCHASEDKPQVRRLYGSLSTLSNVDMWLDDVNLLPGQDWDQEIKSAIRASNVVVVCLSRNSVRKEGYVQKEMREALEMAKEKPEGAIFLVPARLDDCEVPQRLRAYQYASVFTQKGYEKLVTSLRARAETLGIAIGATSVKILQRTLEAPSDVLLPTIGSLSKQFLGEARLVSSISDPSRRLQAASDAAAKFQTIPLGDSWECTWQRLSDRMRCTLHLYLDDDVLFVLGAIPESYLPNVISVHDGKAMLDTLEFLKAFDMALKAGCSTSQLVKTMYMSWTL